jgi:WD40 repeat protein
MHFDPDTNSVVTASEKTIKFLSLNDFEVTKTLTDKGKVYSAFTRKDMLITGTNNGIKLWDLSQDKQLNSLKGHSDIVRCVAFDTNTIVSGSEDNTIKMYNQQKEYTLTGHKGKIQSLQFDRNKVVSGMYL